MAARCCSRDEAFQWLTAKLSSVNVFEMPSRGEQAKEQPRNEQPQPPPKPRFPLIPIWEMRRRVGEGESYLIDEFLPMKGIAVIWGPPKCYKSFFTLDAMFHVAMGWEFHDRAVKQGPVVYMAFEGAHGYPKRSEALWIHYGVSDEATPPLHIMAGQVNLIKDHRLLIEAVRAHLAEGIKPIAIVLDTLNRSLVGSEGKDIDMSNYVRAAEAIRTEFDCLVIIVHHCGWDESHPRGFSGLPAAVDAQIKVTREEAIMRIEVEYMRDGPEGQVLGGVRKIIDVGTDAGGRLLSSLVIEPHELVAGAPRQWPASLKEFHQALVDALLSFGISHKIPKGPTVQAVDIEDVRKRFFEIYIPKHSDDPENAKRSAYNRGVSAAQKKGLISSYCAGKGKPQLVWKNQGDAYELKR
jgi:hypothetical protein